jgi:hypothetical protein
VKTIKNEQRNDKDPREVLRREVKMALSLSQLKLQHVVQTYAYTQCEPKSSCQPVNSGEAVQPGTYALIMEDCGLGSVGSIIRRMARRCA